MSRSYPLIAVLLAMLLVLVGAPAALAQPPDNSHSRGSGPVSFEVLPGVCAAYPTGLKGSGESRVVSNVRTNPDGSTVTTTNAFAKGTATDGLGGSYNFTYSNHSIEVAPTSGPREVSMVDSFVLNGRGDIGNVAIGFNWRWTYTPPAGQWPPENNLVQLSTRGDPFNCDPL